MNIDEMNCEEKLEYYQRQTNQLKKRRDDALESRLFSFNINN